MSLRSRVKLRYFEGLFATLVLLVVADDVPEFIALLGAPQKGSFGNVVSHLVHRCYGVAGELSWIGPQSSGKNKTYFFQEPIRRERLLKKVPFTFENVQS